MPPGFFFLFCCTCVDFLTVLLPCVYPNTHATGEGITGNADNLADTANAEGLQTFAVGIVCDVEGLALFDDVERGTVALQLALAGADGPYFFAVLVVDVVPVLCCLDVTDALCL